MERFAIGEVVIIAFPYSDLSAFKRRPALIIGKAEYDNLIVCQITSKSSMSKLAVPIKRNDFSKGNLPVDSFARPDKLFTLDSSIVQTHIGFLGKEKLESIRKETRQLLKK
jgi:mRNA interferase MazF